MATVHGLSVFFVAIHVVALGIVIFLAVLLIKLVIRGIKALDIYIKKNKE
jgi:hypothetical protein